MCSIAPLFSDTEHIWPTEGWLMCARTSRSRAARSEGMGETAQVVSRSAAWEGLWAACSAHVQSDHLLHVSMTCNVCYARR